MEPTPTLPCALFALRTPRTSLTCSLPTEPMSTAEMSSAPEALRFISLRARKWPGSHRAPRRCECQRSLWRYAAHGGGVNVDDVAMAEVLAAHGADVNASSKNGSTALHDARNKEMAAEFLIAHGADVNARDRNGKTPLHAAAFANEQDVAQSLIAHGAHINSEDKDGKTPMSFATRQITRTR